MIELALTLKAIQSMAMQFSFEYCIVPKDQKSEKEIKEIAVKGAMQDGGVPSEHWNGAALFVVNAFIPLIKNGNGKVQCCTNI